ncbi:MAG: phospholipid-binding protein MlaC [bacterium]
MSRQIFLLVLLLGLSGPLAAQQAQVVAPASTPSAADTALASIIQALGSQSAEQAVELATMEVLAFVERGRDYAEQDSERFYTEGEALLRPMIDFKRFARNVMGPYARNASPEQLDTFAESFKWSLVRTYALAMLEFGDGEAKVLPPRKPSSNPDLANVTQEIYYEGKTYVVVYRMRRGKEDRLWRVQNLVVEGVNIGLNYKSQFTSAMKDPKYNGDLDAVIASWSEFVEAEQSAESTAD